MTIWFSTNIPEMRAISVFNRVSTDIGEIQQRIATGQRINSGKDDPGGLLIRSGLRAEIKNIQSLQTGMLHADTFLEFASGGMTNLIEVLYGTDVQNPNAGSLLGVLNNESGLGWQEIQTAAQNIMKLYDTTVASTMYGETAIFDGGYTKTFQLGGGNTLSATISDLSTATGAAAKDLADAITGITDETKIPAAIAAAKALGLAIGKEQGTLGSVQKIVLQNQQLLESRYTNVVAAEGKISNANLALESSRLARSELLAQNAMNSIMYSRGYAAFAVLSLFR
jgi:flagellin-like hook-associated protein FlgL